MEMSEKDFEKRRADCEELMKVVNFGRLEVDERVRLATVAFSLGMKAAIDTAVEQVDTEVTA
jgi:hypothetical protein